MLIIFFLISYISLIFNNNVWTDEAYTIELVSQNNISGIISGTANDVHPPLYYIIAKAFVSVFGSNIQIYKIVSILPMLFVFILSYTLIRKLFGKCTCILFVLFLNAIPSVLEYVVQIRMYSLAIFLMTLVALSSYCVYCYGNTKYYVCLFISALCACYTHNFAMISTFFIFIILGISLITTQRKFPLKWLICGLAVSVMYIPWLIILYRQTTIRVGNYWISPITLDTIAQYPDDLFGSRIPYSSQMFIILMAIALVLNIVKLVRDKDKIALYPILLLTIPLLTATTGIAVSILLTPFFIARYIIPCMGILALFLAISFSNENRLTLVILCVFLVLMYANSYYTNYVTEYKSTHTQELLDYMDENMGENDIIVYNYEIYGFIYECYFGSNKLIYIDDMDYNTDYDNIWFFDSCYSEGISDSTLEDYNLSEEYIATLGIEQNNFILYKITRQ